MRASRFAALIVLSLALAGVADDAVLASEPTAPDAAYVVTVVPGASSVEAIESADVGDGATPISSEHALTDLSPDEVAALAARADVVSVLPDAPAYAAEVTNDPCVYDGTACGYGPGQVGLRAVGAPPAPDG